MADNRAAIKEAATLGTRELIMVVGGLGAASEPGGPATPDGDKDLMAARARVAARIADLVPIAEGHDVRLVLEPLHPILAADRAGLASLEQCLDWPGTLRAGPG